MTPMMAGPPYAVAPTLRKPTAISLQVPAKDSGIELHFGIAPAAPGVLVAASSTAPMQSGRVSRSSTSRRERMRVTASGLARGGRVQPLEQRHAVGQDLVVVGGGGEQRADRDVDPARFLVRVLPVPQIRLVDDLRQARETPVAQAGALDQRLERAVLTLVAQL